MTVSEMTPEGCSPMHVRCPVCKVPVFVTLVSGRRWSLWLCPDCKEQIPLPEIRQGREVLT